MRSRPLVWASVFVLVAFGLIAFQLVGAPRGQLAEVLQIGMALIFVALMAAKHHLDQKAVALTKRPQDDRPSP